MSSAVVLNLFFAGDNLKLRNIIAIHPSNGATAQIGPWPPLLRFHNNNVLRCEVVSLTTNPR
jgi:hypothetical protein